MKGTFEGGGTTHNCFIFLLPNADSLWKDKRLSTLVTVTKNHSYISQWVRSVRFGDCSTVAVTDFLLQRRGHAFVNLKVS